MWTINQPFFVEAGLKAVRTPDTLRSDTLLTSPLSEDASCSWASAAARRRCSPARSPFREAISRFLARVSRPTHRRASSFERTACVRHTVGGAGTWSFRFA